MEIYDRMGNKIDHTTVESYEWNLCDRYIGEGDVVLELGARYGSSSIVINKRIIDGSNLVCVEPDISVIGSLVSNRDNNGCNFNILNGIISKSRGRVIENGYATVTVDDDGGVVDNYDLWDIERMYGLKFNVLVADCEGCLRVFMEDYPEFFDQLDLVIFESDEFLTCDYNKLRGMLVNGGFRCEVLGFHSVYKRV